MTPSDDALSAKARKMGDYLFSAVHESELVEGFLGCYSEAVESSGRAPRKLSEDDLKRLIFECVSFMAFAVMGTFAETHIKTVDGAPDARAIRFFNDHLSRRILELMEKTGIARVREIRISPTDIELSNLGNPLNLDKIMAEYLSTRSLINAGERFALRVAFTIDRKQYVALKTMTLMQVPLLLKATAAVLDGVFATGPN